MKPSWHGKHVRPVWRVRRFCSGAVPQIDRATNPWWTNAAFVQYGDWSEGTPPELIDRCRELMAQMAVIHASAGAYSPLDFPPPQPTIAS